jgi:hypothetical protein
MTRRTICLASLALGTALVVAPAGAQETIPREVVTALFGPFRGGELLVDRLPEPLPYGIALPQGVTPIGALVRARSGMLAVAFAGDAAAAGTALVEGLTARGWREPQTERPPGFVSNEFGGYLRMLCTDDAFLTYTTLRGTGRTIVRINYNDAARGSPCSPEAGRTRMREGPAPTLAAPADALMRGLGSSSAGTGQQGFYASLETALDLPEVGRHFEAELGRQGWTAAAASTLTDDVFLQRWRHAEGDGWDAVLLAFRTGAGTYMVDFRMWPAGSR